MLVVGVAMRLSRYNELALRSFFPGESDTSDLYFQHVDLWQPISVHCDILLHKISDYMEEGTPLSTTIAVENLREYLSANPQTCVLDELTHAMKVFDRLQLSQLLSSFECRANGLELRAPDFAQVDLSADWQTIRQEAEHAGVMMPCLVKSASACGVPEAHHMALILKWEAFQQLEFRSPAVLQQFVDHGGVLHKVYVIGKKVHVVQKPSIQDVPRNFEQGLPSLIEFNSLSALPELGSKTSVGHTSELNMQLIHTAVAALRDRLHLTLFGFDIAVDYSGTHFIVDVNYFPSFKEVPEAYQHLWAAVEQAHAEWQRES